MQPKTNYQQSFSNIANNAAFKRHLAICYKKSLELRADIKNHQIGAIDIAFESQDLKIIKDLAAKISKFEKILILGVGGSSLGGKTLTALAKTDQLEKIHFLESIDPKTVENTLKKVDLKKTFFLIISKSGQTIETVCQSLIIIEKIKNLGADLSNKIFAKSFLFITETATKNENSAIYKIAKKIKAPIIAHPKNIGGRFSYLCAVGLLPAAIAELDINKIRQGASKIIEEFINNDDANCSIIQSCATQLYLYDLGFSNNVIMPYIDDLRNFNDWYRQLWSESLGKKSFGPIVINSMGTVDQHSQLQLYVDGPKDKFFTFISQKNTANDFLIKDLKPLNTLFGGKKLSKILKTEQDTTIQVLNQKKLPIRNFIFDKIDEFSLSALMMQMFLEVILIAYVKNIDPFDQPGVEIRKKLAKKMLEKL
jgi:glucose-6-phosphate isomerase